MLSCAVIFTVHPHCSQCRQL